MEIGEEFGVFTLKDLGINIVEFWIRFFKLENGVHKFIVSDT
jgi:hypothetical protein